MFWIGSVTTYKPFGDSVVKAELLNFNFIIEFTVFFSILKMLFFDLLMMIRVIIVKVEILITITTMDCRNKTLNQFSEILIDTSHALIKLIKLTSYLYLMTL